MPFNTITAGHPRLLAVQPHELRLHAGRGIIAQNNGTAFSSWTGYNCFLDASGNVSARPDFFRQMR